MRRLLRSPGVAAVLAHQNANLRKAIALEFTALRAGSHPRYYDAMQAYRRTLVEALDTNDATLQSLLGGAPLQSYSWLDDLKLTFGAHDVYDGLGSVWRHLAKDWTADGESAQADLRRYICSIVSAECARLRAASVVIPGCGQGRLAYDIACVLPDDASVIGIERSPAQLAIARHFLPVHVDAMEEPAALPFHPWLDAFTNNLHPTSRAARLIARRPTTADDKARPPPPSLTMIEGDFTALFSTPLSASSAHEKHDVCVTSFFMDCLDDLAEGVRAVHQSLRPGGLWVFAGPLHFGQGGGGGLRPSPTLEQLLTLVQESGFALEAADRSAPPSGAGGQVEGALPVGVEMVHAPYVARPGAFLLEADWTVPLFAARRV